MKCIRYMVNKNNTVKRVKTGISSIDNMIQGGFPEGSILIVTGPPGSGKTIFGLEYLYKGVTEYKEKGIFISLEMPTKEMERQASQFGWDLAKAKDMLKLVFVHSEYQITGTKILSPLIDSIKKSGAKRVVIDSISSFIAFYIPLIIKTEPNLANATSDTAIRFSVYSLIEELRQLDVTVVLISDSPNMESSNYSLDGVSEYLCDGIINLHYLAMGEEQARTLEIPKMRFTKQVTGYVPYAITDEGIVLDTERKTGILMK